jgi:hypothetical protein
MSSLLKTFDLDDQFSFMLWSRTKLVSSSTIRQLQFVHDSRYCRVDVLKNLFEGCVFVRSIPRHDVGFGVVDFFAILSFLPLWLRRA